MRGRTFGDDEGVSFGEWTDVEKGEAYRKVELVRVSCREQVRAKYKVAHTFSVSTSVNEGISFLQINRVGRRVNLLGDP